MRARSTNEGVIKPRPHPPICGLCNKRVGTLHVCGLWSLLAFLVLIVVIWIGVLIGIDIEQMLEGIPAYLEANIARRE